MTGHVDEGHALFISTFFCCAKSISPAPPEGHFSPANFSQKFDQKLTSNPKGSLHSIFLLAAPILHITQRFRITVDRKNGFWNVANATVFESFSQQLRNHAHINIMRKLPLPDACSKVLAEGRC